MRIHLNDKAKQTLSISFTLLSVCLVVLLFVFKGKLSSYASKAIEAQAGAGIRQSERSLIDSAFNYTVNGKSYQVTFLEFGANGCSACMRMETEMDNIRQKYPERVNVLFVNILMPDNQKLMKYFGIAAIPTQVLLDREGKEFFRHTGYISSEELLGNISLKQQ